MATIVPLKRGPSAWPPVLRDTWHAIERALHPALQAWGDAADDALFRRSEKGEDAHRAFEAMRLLRKIRPQLDADILARVRPGTDRSLSDGRIDAPPAPGPVGLTLVGHEELEEALAVSAMAERAEREAGPQWEALRQRVAHVLQRPHGPLPVEPGALAQATRAALDAIEEFDTPVRLTLLKLFERHAWPVLNDAVVARNDELVRQGVLPNLAAPKPKPSRQAEDRPAPVGAVPPGVPAGAQAPAAPGWDPAATQELLALLAQFRPVAGHTSAPGALTPAGPLPSPRELRDQLLASLPAHPRHADHVQAIDLVALVFDFLLKDEAMPPPIQAQLARLQLPYLRVAVLDPHGFAQGHHPARQLLDVLGQIGQTWSTAEDPQGRLLAALRATVERLSDDGQTDLATFTQERDAWLARQHHDQTRASRLSQRAIELQSGHDRKQAAQREVATAFVQRLGNVDLPGTVRQLLQQHWAAAMMLMWLREGETSAAYRRAVFLLDQIRAIAQAQPGSAAAERLERMRPSLRLTLDQGWDLLALDGRTKSAMIATLDAFLAGRTGHPHARPVVTAVPAGAATVAPPTVTLPEVIAVAPPTALPTPAPNIVTPPVAAIEPGQKAPPELAVGTWLAFDHHGVAHRGKLSWVSPFTGCWLMVSAQGLKVADLDPREVARQLADGRARLISPDGLVSRALQAQA